MRRESPQNRQGPGLRLSPAGEGIGFSLWQQKDRTKKVETTEFYRDVTTLRAVKEELVDGGRGGRNGHAVRDFRGQ